LFKTICALEEKYLTQYNIKSETLIKIAHFENAPEKRKAGQKKKMYASGNRTVKASINIKEDN